MRALTGELLLIASDRGAAENDLNRALTLLSLALPESGRSQLAKLTLAERNMLLLRLRELSFGPTLGGFGTCSQCSAHLEFALGVSALVERLRESPVESALVWSDSGENYRLRSVTTEDLLAILEEHEAVEAGERLLARCLTVPEGGRTPGSATELPGVIEKFEQLHAAAEISCVLECPECGLRQTLDLDITRFLWLEVRAAARRLVAEIHQLAWAYGWSERAIARMSHTRRNAYLEMLSA